MKIQRIILILITLVILVIAGTIYYYSFFKVIKVQKANYFFSVDEKVGLNADMDALKFGSVPSGSVGTRGVLFKNTFDKAIIIRIKISGEKKEWIYSEENDFILEPEEEKKVKFIVTVPDNAKNHINYTGRVIAQYIKT